MMGNLEHMHEKEVGRYGKGGTGYGKDKKECRGIY